MKFVWYVLLRMRIKPQKDAILASFTIFIVMSESWQQHPPHLWTYERRHYFDGNKNVSLYVYEWDVFLFFLQGPFYFHLFSFVSFGFIVFKHFDFILFLHSFQFLVFFKTIEHWMFLFLLMFFVEFDFYIHIFFAVQSECSEVFCSILQSKICAVWSLKCSSHAHKVHALN